MATTIRIADTVHPAHHRHDIDDDAITSAYDGIYNLRTISRTSSRERSRTRTFRTFESKEIEDDDPGLRQSGDFKTRQV